MEFLKGLLSNVFEQPWYLIFVQVVGVFALIAQWTKNEVDNKIVNFLLKAINFLGANNGRAKNAD